MEENIQNKTIVLNDSLVNYVKTGNENSKATLLFLHGWRSDLSVWKKIISDLKSDYLIYAIDLPGFGKSESPKRVLTIQDYSQYLYEFIQKLNLKNVVLIGHSNGGKVSIKFASDNTFAKLINKIVLIDSSGIKINKNELKFKKIIAKIVKPFFAPAFMQGIRKKIYKTMGAEDYLETPELKETFLNLINEDLINLLPNITVPTLIIWGRNDKDTPLEIAKILHNKIKDSKLEILNNAGHFSFLDKYEEFERILVNFLSH